MKKIILYSLILFCTKFYSQNIICSNPTLSIPFNNTDLCQIYSAVRNSTSSVITGTTNFKDNSADTLNARLNKIWQKLEFGGSTKRSISDFANDINNKLIFGTTPIAQITNSINTVLNGTINVRVVNNPSVTVTNTLVNTQMTLLNNQIALLQGVQFASTYVSQTFTNSTQIGLDSDLNTFFGTLITEKIKTISYSSNAVWNGLAIIREYNCLIIYTP